VGERLFVDCHSHVCPSGDDGAASSAEAIELARDAARHGTGLLFATPHVWPHLLLSAERERAVRAAYAGVRPHARLELRLGFELTPCEPLLGEDPRRYVLEGTTFVLMEVPFAGRLAEHVQAAGLRPLVAHPERAEAVLAEPALAGELAARGWPLQVNATSLLGGHGAAAQELGWRLLEDGTASVVASDGHRQARPARLDAACAAAVARLGADAQRFFDGSALGLAATARPLPARAASPGA
jgi:protein-tyrosine phosphatase